MQKRGGVQGLLLEEVVFELEELWRGERRVFLAEGLPTSCLQPSPGWESGVVTGADGQEVRVWGQRPCLRALQPRG